MMTTQARKATIFRALHVKGDPLTLYNIWDAGGARTLESAGARAVATGSWSVAAAHGYEDGEAIPLDFVLQIVARIAASCALPLSVDFEGGYANEPEAVGANVGALLRAGAIGLNLEDGMAQGGGLRGSDQQAARLSTARRAADQAGVAAFVNARTDLFLQAEPGAHPGLVDEALARARAYADAGADGFFVPGLTDLSLIAAIAERTPLPLNVMMAGDLRAIKDAARAGAARVSFGPAPYRAAMADLAARHAATGAA